MSRGRRFARRLARVVACGAIAATAHGALAALVDSNRLFRYARRHGGDSLELAQDRLFGRAYMESIRAVRRRIDVRDAVHFVQEKPPDGSSYFALYHLAPRTLFRHWRLESPPQQAPGRLDGDQTVMIRVPRRNAPLGFVESPAAPPSAKRARKARP